MAIYSNDKREYKQKINDMSLSEDGWEIENMGLPDNLMLIAPTHNVIFESFEEAVSHLSKMTK